MSRPPATDRTVPRPLALVTGIVVAAGLVATTAWIGGSAPSGSGNAWYAGLEKAPFNPPDAVFPIAWTTLYVLMVVSAGLVWRAAGARLSTARHAATLFAAQLVLNGLWSWVFFAWHLPRVALGVLAALWVLVAALIAAHPLVKGLTGTWSVSGKGMQGDHTGTSSYALACGETVVVNHYTSKAGTTEFHGLGVGKLSDDGKTATLWWFDNYMPGVLVFTGPATDAGYELTVKEGEMAGAKATMTKKGDGWQFVLSAGADEFVNETYTRAK